MCANSSLQMAVEGNFDWRHSQQKVCLNPSADMEPDRRRRSTTGSGGEPTIEINGTPAPINKTPTRSRAAKKMTIDKQQNAPVNCKQGSFNAYKGSPKQQGDPVLPHETSPKGNNEGVFTAKNLPHHNQQQQQQRRQWQPTMVVEGTRPTATTMRNNNGGSGGSKAKEDTSRQQRASCHRAHQQQQRARQQFGAGDEEHPLDAASLISKLFFGWMFPFVYRGWRFGLERADLPRRPSAADSCHKIGDKLVANWNKELASCNHNHHLRPQRSLSGHSRGDLYEKQWRQVDDGCHTSGSCGRRPSLVRAVLRTHAKWILFNSSITLFSEVICKSLSAYSVGQMLELMSQRETGDYSRVWSLEEPLVCWTLTLILSLCLWVLSAHFYGFQMMRVGLHIRVGCSYLIYRKSLKLGQFESSQKTMGKMINLMTNDLDKFNYVFILLPYIWIGPIQCVVSVYLLWPTLGPASLGALLVISIILPIHFYLGSKFAKYRRRIATITDERVRLLDDTISALKLIKLYAWEYPMRGAMLEVRSRETHLINRVGIIKATSSALMFISSKLVLFVTILLHCTVFGASLDARTLFMSMALLNNIQFTMCQMMPRSVGLWVESLVSLGRIGNFLMSSEFEASSRLCITGHNLSEIPKNAEINTRNKLLTPPQQVAANYLPVLSSTRRAFIEYQQVCASWPEATRKTLDSIRFRCQAPELVVICGQLASGKSSLLLTLLNELPISGGKARLNGTCGYASQKAWIFNGTLRENIVFGSEFNEQRYRQVIQVCALERDLELLDSADLTYIQANSLSGGQQARVNLARCLYRQCDIYLLDDPFSALDDRVAEHIFEDAIKKFLSNKLVLLATHHVGTLKQSDKVLLLDGGKQLAYCTPDELHRKLISIEESKCFTDEQLQSLSFLVEGLEKPTTTTSVAAGGDKEPGRSEQGVPQVAGSDNCCEVAQDGIIDNAAIKESRNPNGRMPANATSAASDVSTSDLVKANTPDGRSLRPILAGATVDAHRGDPPVHSASTTNEPGSADSVLQQGPSTITTTTTTTETVAYGHSREGNKSDLISDSDASGAPPVVATAVASGHESQRGVAVSEETVEDKVDSTTNKNGSQWTIEGHYRTSERNVEQCGGDGKSPSPLIESLERVVQEQRKEHSKMGQERGIDRKKEKKVAAASSGNGPADEEMDSSSNKLPGLHVWYKYYTQTSVIRLMLIILTFLITQALFSTVDIYLAVWSLVEQNKALANEITLFNQQQLATFKQQHDEVHEPWQHKFNYGDGMAERMRALNRSRLGYDLMAGGGSGKLTPLLDWPLVENGGLSSSSADMDMIEEIEKASISPLSLRSSRQSLTSSSSSELIPTRMQAGLLDVSNVDSTTTEEVSASETTQNSIKRLQLHDSLSANSQVNLKLKVKQFEQVVIHTQPDAAPASSALASNNISPSNNNYHYYYYHHDNLASSITSPPSTATTILAVDHNICEQSDEALNVKSIYRPLYLFASNFISEYQYHLTYTILLVVLFLSSTISNCLAFTSSTKSAKILYRKLIDNALFAKLEFFDKNPTARLLNRATRDIGIIDETIPMQAQQAYELLLRTAATFIMVAATDFNLALPSLVILFIFFIYHSISVKPTKDIQRLEGILRSPILAHVSTSLDGLHTIRSSKSEHRFEQLFLRHQDENSSVFLLQIGCNRSTAIVLDCLSAFYTSIIALWAVVSGLTGPAAGLIVTSAMLLSGLTSHGILKLTETESLMTSVERVIEYCSLPQEENYDTTRQGAIGGGDGRRNSTSNKRWVQWLSTSNNGNYNITATTTEQQIARTTVGWPNSGSVEYRNVDFYYNNNNKLENKPVLKNISFRLQSGEKVAIVGRTGAGKSSIIATLFKLYDFNGTILIDGVDINNIDLIQLRSAIGVIPQSSVLFSTTIRRNLDPFGDYDDLALWSALNRAHLRETVASLPGKLDFDIGSGGGTSFSSGQKQLFCLARVLLRQTRLIVMDEATANVDPNTDSIIQATIRREFKHCTVITIAHRLETILDYDRIMVLDAGRIVDFDSPERLASKKDGFFASGSRPVQ